MSDTIQLDLPVLLPGVDDEQDACVHRLVELLQARDGVDRVHIAHIVDGVALEHEVGEHPPHVTTPGALCLHYDPDRITLAQITELAHTAGAEVSDRYGHSVIPFHAVGPEDDGPRIEAALADLAGVTAASVNFAAQTVRVEYDTRAVSHATILARLREAGATPTPALGILATAPALAEGWYTRNRELAWSLAAGTFMLIGWAVGRVAAINPAIPLVCYAVAYAFGARDCMSHVVGDIRRRRFRLNIDALMVVAALGAAALGEWFEGALLLFLFSLGHALEHYALGRARNAIRALAELAPSRAMVRRNGVDQVVPIEQVSRGDLVTVRPGERIAVDGRVRDGRSAVNQAPITGESVPVDRGPGDELFAGSVNGDGVLLVDVTAAVGDRTLDRVIALVAEAGTRKARVQQVTERFQRVFVPMVLVVDVLVMVVPPLLGVWTWPVAFYRAMALLVAASPCALALGTPATVLAAIAQAARNGVLIKGGAALESLGLIEIFAFDKTGTITRGEPDVTDVVPMPGTDEATLLQVAAAVERQSQHPLARAVVRAAESRRLVIATATEVTSVSGHGITGRVDGHSVEIGRLAFFDEGGVPADVRTTVTRLEQAGRTTMVVRQGSTWLGVIGLADEPRAGVRETLTALRAAGARRIVMLSGDNPSVAAAVAQRVGIDEVRAGLLPADKLAAVRELGVSGPVAMVGDGVNDAPALANATVGIAMGGAGSAAALETADVALMSDDIGQLPFAVALSRRARGVIRQNLAVSLLVIVGLSIATIAGWARIGPAVVVHEGSTLVVIANALRLLRRTPSAG